MSKQSFVSKLVKAVTGNVTITAPVMLSAAVIINASNRPDNHNDDGRQEDLLGNYTEQPLLSDLDL